jgi:hypothetical protein
MFSAMGGFAPVLGPFRAGCANNPKGKPMRSLAYALPPLPGFDSPKTYAAWPVWSGGTTDQIKWPKVVKKAVVEWARTNETPGFVA